MSQLQAFLARIDSDARVRTALQAVPETSAFIERAVEFAAESGLAVDSNDLAAAMAHSREIWFRRGPGG